tara:strand:- start:296 stop:490 length:195 start_codon:yes stop_codon:yes gene_type:complete
MKNENLKQAVKVITIAGAAILVVNNGMKLTSVSTPKGAVMPLVSILVGLAAFKYAMATPTIVKS